MGFFDKKENVEQYLKLANGYDGRELIEILKKYLPNGSSVLELGSGPGKDLDILNETYIATGSDTSKIFKDLYIKNHPGSVFQILDAVNLETDERYDAIFSNKVLQHLTIHDLKKSLERQKDIAEKDGIVFHSLWKGDKIEEFSGLYFQYYLEDKLKDICDKSFEVIDIASYSEMEDDDSLYVILKNSK